MATPKKPAAAKSTAVVPWEAEMAQRDVKAAKAEKITGLTKKLSTRGGILSIDDTPVEDNELRVIVVGSVHENQYYTEAYNPNTPTVPACYSFSDPEADAPEDGMAPHEEAEDKQGDDNGLCSNCWANQMGSADVGRGKACKNIRRLAVITEDALESVESLSEAEVRMLNVPVMSTKNWAKFVNAVAEDMSRPYWAVVCLVKVVPDPKSQFQITFKFEELINFDGELYEAMKKKVTAVNQQLVLPYLKQADLAVAQPVRPQVRMAQAMAKKAPPGKPAVKPAAKPAAKPAPAAKRGKF